MRSIKNGIFRLFLGGLLVALAGCVVAPSAGTVSISKISGQSEDGSLEFFGEATTDGVSGTGILSIELANDFVRTGIFCDGKYVYTSLRKAEGTFACNDGRTGAFDFVAAGRSAIGKGRLGTSPFTFEATLVRVR